MGCTIGDRRRVNDQMVDGGCDLKNGRKSWAGPNYTILHALLMNAVNVYVENFCNECRYPFFRGSRQSLYLQSYIVWIGLNAGY